MLFCTDQIWKVILVSEIKITNHLTGKKLVDSTLHQSVRLLIEHCIQTKWPFGGKEKVKLMEAKKWMVAASAWEPRKCRAASLWIGTSVTDEERILEICTALCL